MSMQLVRVLSVLLLVRLATSVTVVSPGHDCALKVKFGSCWVGDRFGELVALSVTS